MGGRAIAIRKKLIITVNVDSVSSISPYRATQSCVSSDLTVGAQVILQHPLSTSSQHFISTADTHIAASLTKYNLLSQDHDPHFMVEEL